MKKIFVVLTLIMISMLNFSPHESRAFSLSNYPDEAYTKTKTIHPISDNDFEIQVTYPSRIYEGQDLPIRIKYSNRESLTYTDIDKFATITTTMAGSPSTSWHYMSSYNSGSDLGYQQTTTTDYYYDVSDFTPGTYSSHAGLYGIRYDYDWFSGDDTVATFTEQFLSFTVVTSDTTPPVIQGDTVVFSNMDDPVNINDVQSSLSATDETDGNVTSTIINIDDQYTGNENIPGDYITTWQATDASGNISQLSVIVRVVDVTKPIISLSGLSTMYIEYDTTFSDPGATATDNNDGDLTSSIVTSGTVNTSVIGSYSIDYDVSDSTGNDAITKTRTVIVRDTTDPSISLNGSSTLYIGYDTTFSDPGAEATDDYDGDLTSSINVSGTVNTSVLGSYTLTYTVDDSSGNTDSASRTVIVQDITDPNISLSGGSTIYVETGTTFNDPGATATDNYDGDLSSSINVSGTVDTSALGSYTLTYTVDDSSGNTDSVTRTVIIQDTTNPVINYEGDSTVTVQFGDVYIEDGFTATDNLDGDLTESVVVTDNSDYSNLGTYTVTYEVSDASGNIGTASRTIIIEDLLGAVINVTDHVTYNSQVTLLSELTSGMSAIDLLDGDLTSSIVITADTYTGNETTVGTYSVTYEVTDSLGNLTTKTITIEVMDDLPPVFNYTSYLIEKSVADAMTLQQIIDHLNTRDN
jgi:hypothetical protein